MCTYRVERVFSVATSKLPIPFLMIWVSRKVAVAAKYMYLHSKPATKLL